MSKSRRTYSEIAREDGLKAVLEECFRRKGIWPDQVPGTRQAFMRVAYYAIEQSFNGTPTIIGYAGYKTVYEKNLINRKFIVTLWDYAPGITFIDGVFDARTRTLRAFANDDERTLIEQHAAIEEAIFTKNDEFNGVL